MKKTMPAGEFKIHCLKIMDVVQQTRQPVTITKRGRPVATLVPAETPADDFLGRLQGVVTIHGDIESPVEPPEAWDSLK